MEGKPQNGLQEVSADEINCGTSPTGTNIINAQIRRIVAVLGDIR